MDKKTNVDRVNRIGKALLSKNNLPTKIQFKVLETDDINAFANADKEIYTANNVSMLKMSRTEEYEADITGADLMTKAGYNPLAMVSVLYKIGGNYKDFVSTHPSGDKRTMYIYDYITYTYPDKVKAGYNTDSYKQFMAYAEPIIKERNSNPKKLAAFNKSQEKLKAKRIAKLEKYKNAKDSNGWDKSFNVIRAFSN